MSGPTNLLREAKRLYDMGWAIHWLYPSSKRPLSTGWTTGPRAEWSVLRARFSDSNNVGVRLGSASRLATGYLACLDCDVKSDDPAHRAEMEKRLDSLYPSILENAPVVTSGRGLGSRHVYGVTSEPLRVRILAQSGDEVRVRMPTVKPSGREQRLLSPQDLKRGIRLRPAWEITLMSEGRQMVIPPSIHPDSGKRYVWDRAFEGASALPSLDPTDRVEALAVKPKAAAVPKDFRFTPVDVDFDFDERTTPELRRLVEDVEGFEDDHSRALFKACGRMYDVGFTDEEILTVLTDPQYTLGECAYRHIQKPVDVAYRERAALWVKRFNLDPAKAKVSQRAQFDANVEELPPPPPLSDEQAAEQEAELVGGGDDRLLGDWRMDLERGGQNGEGRPKPTLSNVLLVLTHGVAPNVFRKCQFSLLELYGCDTPWGGREGRELSDADLIGIKVWIASHFRFEPTLNLVNEAVKHIAEENPFHPVREYLDGLEWDGVPRIDTWLKRLLQAQAPEPYLSAVSRKVLVAMVARVMEPGVKFDTVLILENERQGVGKSTVVRKLASDAWFSDAHIDIKDKDAVLAMRGIWAVELGELSSLRKADVDQLKEFMSRTTDRIRVPYGHRTEAFPRQCVFIGTTNSTEYFRDPTGNRRFWPVEVGECDFKAVERERDQLFAEAVWYYQLGEPLYLDDKEALSGAVAEQESRSVHDALVELLDEFFERQRDQVPGERRFNPDCFTMNDVFGDYGPMAGGKMDHAAQLRVAQCLRKLGFRRIVKRRGSKTLRVWERVTG